MNVFWVFLFPVLFVCICAFSYFDLINIARILVVIASIMLIISTDNVVVYDNDDEGDVV